MIYILSYTLYYSFYSLLFTFFNIYNVQYPIIKSYNATIKSNKNNKYIDK